MTFIDDARNAAKSTRENILDKEKRLIAAVSSQCSTIADNLKNEIMRNAKGHSSNPLEATGILRYRLKDEEGGPGHFYMNDLDIERSEGYGKLKALCTELGVKMTMEHSPSDVDDLDYLDIWVSGW